MSVSLYKPRPSAYSYVCRLAHSLVHVHSSPQLLSPKSTTPTLPSNYSLGSSPHPTSSLPTLTTRKVTELLKTFCESKRLTTDKVGAGLRQMGSLGGKRPSLQSRGRASARIPSLEWGPHTCPVPRPTSKTCLTS